MKNYKHSRFFVAAFLTKIEHIIKHIVRPDLINRDDDHGLIARKATDCQAFQQIIDFGREFLYIILMRSDFTRAVTNNLRHISSWLSRTFGDASNYNPTDVERIIPRADMSDIRRMIKYGNDGEAIEYLNHYLQGCAVNESGNLQELHQKMVTQLCAHKQIPEEFKVKIARSFTPPSH